MDSAKDVRLGESSTPPPQNDDVIVELLMSDDLHVHQGGVTLLYKKHGRALYAIAHRACQDRDLADEAMIDVLGSLQKRMKNYQHRGNFFAWLAKAVENRARDIRRRRDRYLNRFVLMDNVQPSGESHRSKRRDGSSRSALDRITLRQLQDALADLEPTSNQDDPRHILEEARLAALPHLLAELQSENARHYQAFVMRVRDGMSYADIARRLRITQANVRQCVVRARMWLMKKLPAA